MLSYPKTNEHSRGLIWLGTDPITEADLEGMKDMLTGEPITMDMVDPGTTCGTYAPEWITGYDEAENTERHHRSGGLGSRVYEEQKLNEGVRIEMSEVFWYNEDGLNDKSIPDGIYGEGVVHDVTNVEYAEVEVHYGPEPGSPAELQLDGKIVIWDENHCYYDVVEDD